MSNVCVMLIIPWRHLCMCLFNIWSHSILHVAPYCARSRSWLIPELLAPTPLQSIWKLLVFCLCLCLFVPDFVLFCLSLYLFFLWLIQALSALTTLSLSFVYPSLSYFVFFFVANPRAINTNPPWPSIWRLQVFCQTVPLVMYCKHLHLNPLCSLSKKINETLLLWMLFNLSVQKSRSPSTTGEICIIPPI